MENGKLIYHPASMDIIEYKVIGTRIYDDMTMYEAQATANVGACGRVKVLLTADKNGTLRFSSLLDDYEYESGLGDFVEGIYYANKQEARLAYYELQKTLVWSNMCEKERLYKQAKSNYEKVERILNEIKKDLNEQTI